MLLSNISVCKGILKQIDYSCTNVVLCFSLGNADLCEHT